MRLVDNQEVLSVQNFDHYLESQFLPHVKSLYATTVKVHMNLEDVLKLMVQAIQKNERTENEVSVTKLQCFETLITESITRNLPNSSILSEIVYYKNYK